MKNMNNKITGCVKGPGSRALEGEEGVRHSKSFLKDFFCAVKMLVLESHNKLHNMSATSKKNTVNEVKMH